MPRTARRAALGKSMNVDCFADDLRNGHARIKRAVRVLENHLEPAPSLAECAALQARDVVAFEENPSGGWFDETNDRASKCGLAAAAFADESECFSGRDVETHIIDGLDVFGGATEESAFHGKVHLEIADFEEVHMLLRRWRRWS
jgi:hypothetical protein